jgi:ABC-type Fe3+/spermidine/putrescine transport system ATPase subunit
MRDGEIVQIGTPNDLYHNPKSSFVAQFIGTTNLLPIEKMENQRIYAPFPLDINRPFDPQTRYVSIRPETIFLQEFYAPGQLTGTIVSKNLLGSIVRYTVKIKESSLIVDLLHNPAHIEKFTENMTVGITIPADACKLLE